MAYSDFLDCCQDKKYIHPWAEHAITRDILLLWKIPLTLNREFTTLFHPMHWSGQRGSEGIILDCLLANTSRPSHGYALLGSVYLRQFSLKKKYWTSRGLKKFSRPVDAYVVISLALADIGKRVHIFTGLTRSGMCESAHIALCGRCPPKSHLVPCGQSSRWACGIYSIPIYEDCCTQVDYCSVCD